MDVESTESPLLSPPQPSVAKRDRENRKLSMCMWDEIYTKRGQSV